MNFFNPVNPKYRRGVHILSIIMCTGAASQGVLFDYGTQDHVFTPIQKFVNKKLDTFFEVTEHDLTGPRPVASEDESKPFFKMTRVDYGDGVTQRPK